MTIPANVIVTDYPDRQVLHNGTLFNGVEPVNLGPYLTDRGLEVPAHWHNARVVDRKGNPITIKRTPAQIVAANRMFPFGQAWKGAKSDSVTDYQFKGPMDSAGIVIYMPTTGERPEIGLITDPSAAFMRGAAPGPMLAWAQAASSCPMHFRDETTGKPIDLLKYPKANSYSQDKQGSPWLKPGEPDTKAPAFRAFGGGWTPQQAHYCEMSYLAHIATLDPTFLEDLQYSANFTVLCDAYVSGQRGIATVAGEYRGIAWAFRNLFMAHIATLDAEARGDLPPSCHPSNYWKTLLDNQLVYYSQFMADPKNQTFRLVSGDGGRFGPWQADYMLQVLAFGVLTGHSDWVSLYLWALKNAIDRTSGKSGYPVGYGGAYYLNTRPYKLDANGKTIKDDFDLSKPQFDWKGAYLYQQIDPESSGLTQAQIDALEADQFNAVGGFKPYVGLEYLMRTRAVLVMAQRLDKLGMAAVRATYPDLDTCLFNVERQLQAKDAGIALRTSVVLDENASPAPPVVTPVPGTSQPSDPSQPSAPPVVVSPVPPPPIGFRPAKPTPDDIRDESPETYFKVTDKKSRNIIGDGGTVVLWQWEGGGPDPAWFKDPKLTADGGFIWEENHASGQVLTLYGCAGLSINGMLVKMPAAYPFPQAPAPQPVPEPKPDPVPVPTPRPIARVAVSAIDTKIIKRAQAGETIIVTVSKKDAAGLVPLSKLT